MKPKMKRQDLMCNMDITNAVTDVLVTHNLSSKDNALNKAAIVYQYYCELESGGHESLFRWFGQAIQEMGLDHYVNKLIGVLEEIGAHDYAMIEKNILKRCGTCTLP